MPQPIENVSSDLVDLLKDRFEISDTVNEAGQFTDDPAEMKVFSFNYITKKGEDKGCVVISLLDDSESSNSMKIYFGQELADADSDTRTEWYKFLQELRQFAKIHLLGFDVRNINKSQITRRDVEKDLVLVKEDIEIGSKILARYGLTPKILAKAKRLQDELEAEGDKMWSDGRNGRSEKFDALCDTIDKHIDGYIQKIFDDVKAGILNLEDARYILTVLPRGFHRSELRAYLNSVERDANSKLVKEDLTPMFEGSFEPIDGTAKTSHQKLAGKPIKIVIKHTTKVDPEVRGSRSRRIAKIYLVNADNERFLLPFRNLIAARAMARHIENGGTPYDNVGRDICQLVEEMVSLNKFWHKQKDSDAASKPYVSSILAATRERYLNIKKTLASLSSKGGYAKNSLTLTGNAGELEADDEMFEDVFDGAELDEESQLALPHVMKAYRSNGKVEEQDEFEKWVNAAKGEGAGQEILADEEEPYSANDFKNSSVRGNELPTTPDQRHTQFISMDGSNESRKNSGKILESTAQRVRGKEAGKRDIGMLRQQKAESEENFPFEYGGMNGSIPTSDEISGVGGEMTFESHDFKTGDKVYHKNLELKGVVIDPPFLGNSPSSVLVKFDDNGYEEDMEVSTNMLVHLNESIPDREDNDLRNQWTACEEYGHRYTIGNDPEVYNSCINCGEPRDTSDDITDPIVTREREKLNGIDLNDGYKTPYIEGFVKNAGQAIVNTAKRLKNIVWPDAFNPAILDQLRNLDQNHFTVAQVAEAIKVPMFIAQQICDNGVKDGSFIDHIGMTGSYYSTKQAVPAPNYFDSKKWGLENRPSMHIDESAECNHEYELTWNKDWEKCSICGDEKYVGYDLDRDTGWEPKDTIDESIADFFGFGKEQKTNEDTLILEKLMRALNFELVDKTANSQIWRKSYFTVIFGPTENKKLGWAINRNGQFKSRGFGSKEFFEEFFMNNPEFRQELHRIYTQNEENSLTEDNAPPKPSLKVKCPKCGAGVGYPCTKRTTHNATSWASMSYNVPMPSHKARIVAAEKITEENRSIIDELLIEADLLEADVPSSAAWGSPLTFVSADLPNHYRTSKEIAHHKNTTGKLSPFSLLNRQESDKDADGKDLNQVSDFTSSSRPIQSPNAGGFAGKKGNERPSNL